MSRNKAVFRGEIRITWSTFISMCKEERTAFDRDQRKRCVIYSVPDGDILLISARKNGSFTDTTNTFTDTTNTGFIYPFHCRPVFDETLNYMHESCDYSGRSYDVSEYSVKAWHITEKEIGDYWKVILVRSHEDSDISKVIM